MTVTRLWLVRHAPTHARAAIGWTDIAADISDTDAFARLTAQLPAECIRVSSDLQRTIATAEMLPCQEVLPPRADLREMNFGDWDGKRFSEISKTDPDLARRYWSEPGDIAPPNGESWNGFQTRIAAALDAVCAAHQGRDILIVVHFGTILAALATAANLPPKSVFAFKIDNLSLTRIDHLPQEKNFVVHGVNQVF